MNGVFAAGRRAVETTSRTVLDARGCGLTELMVGSLAGAIMLAAALDVFNRLHARAYHQYRAVAHQQDIRIGLEVFEQEVRLATAGAVAVADAAELRFHANVGGQRTVTTAEGAPGQVILSVQDGSGWGGGKTVAVCDAAGCERHELARAGQRYQLTLTQPLNRTIASGASVEIVNLVRYYAARDAHGTTRLMRMIDGGANPLIADLEVVRLTYRDRQGHLAGAPAQVSRVVLELRTARQSRPIVREVSLRS